MQYPWVTLAATSKVCDLIDRDLGRWNNAVIAANFFKEEAAVIQNIPLSLLFPKDKLI
jgi:hypothetical protein